MDLRHRNTILIDRNNTAMVAIIIIELLWSVHINTWVGKMANNQKVV